MPRTQDQIEYLRANPPSARLLAVLGFIHGYTTTYAKSPSYADIAERFGVSKTLVARWILALERRGLVAKRPYHPRSLRVVGPIPKPAANGHGK